MKVLYGNMQQKNALLMHYLLLICLLCSTMVLEAQTYINSYKEGFITELHKTAVINDSIAILALDSSDRPDRQKSHVIKYNYLRGDYTNVFTLEHDYVDFFDLDYLGGDTMAILYNRRGCDYGSGVLADIVLFSWQTGERLNEQDILPKGEKLTKLNDSLYVLVDGGVLKLLDQDFEPLFTNPLIDPENVIRYGGPYYIFIVFEVSTIDEATIHIETIAYSTGPDGWFGKVDYLLQIGRIADTVYLNYETREMETIDGLGDGTLPYFYYLDDQGIYRRTIGRNLSPGLSNAFLPINYQTTSDKHIEKSGDKLLVWEHDTTQLFLHVTDTNLVNINTYSWPLNGNEIPIVGASFADSIWMFITHEESPNRTLYPYVWERGYGRYVNFRTVTNDALLMTGPPLLHDLALVDMQYNEAQLITERYVDRSRTCDDMYAFTYPEVEVTIKNNGLRTVNDLDILYSTTDTFRCRSFCVHYKTSTIPLTNLQLHPGDSMTVQLLAPIVDFQYGGESDFCLWLSAPNGAVDRTPMSNLGCFSPPPIRPSSTVETSANDAELLYNTTTQTLHIDSQVTGQLLIVNTLGQQLKHLSLGIGQHQLTFGGDLPTGTYFAIFQGKDGKRIVKQLITY